ncbi:MAG: NAD-dependent epimerase/dehydratase family protein [Thioploca sp.]|nr:NAD-dependent epimerase/dehydratase family protein [Thioploca sp.]
MNTACITGITGQTGSYLCDLLLSKGYKVYGLKRRSSSLNTERIDHVYVDPHIDSNKLEMVYGDLADYSSLASWIGDIKPDLFFNMGAQSHVRVSFDIPEYTMDVTGTGVMRVLEAIRKNSPKTKFLTASSSEMFGSQPPPQAPACLRRRAPGPRCRLPARCERRSR